jgi:hypothetical protein
VCEAGPPVDGSLYSILEAEGFDLVGLLGTAEALERLLPMMDPNVLVLDAEAGAMALLAARELAPQVAVVVVWPAGTRAETADQFVEPSRAATELGAAVLRASRRHHLITGPTIVSADLRVVPDLDRVELVDRTQEPEPEPEPVPAPAAVTTAATVAAVAAARALAASSPAAAATSVTPIGSVTAGPASAAAPRASGTSRLRTRASVALVAACLFLALVIAIASQPIIPADIGALPPSPSASPSGSPGNSGGRQGGSDHAPDISPPAGNPPVFGLTSLAVIPAATTTESQPSDAGTPVTHAMHIQHRRSVRHRVRHNRRQRRRRSDNGGSNDGGGGKGNGNGQGNGGGPPSNPGGSGDSHPTHPAHPTHPSHPPHPSHEGGDDHGGSDNGHGNKHGDPDD